MAEETPETKVEGESDEQRVEQMVREVTERLREMPNREELIDYAISLLRETAEDLGQEQARQAVKQAGGEAFNPIAFAIPLLIVGAVLCATGILVGPGLGVIAIALLMALYGGLLAVFGRRRARGGT